MLKRFLLTVCVSLLASFTVFAQQKSETSNAAILVDEFGLLPNSDVIARLDNLVVALENNPTAKAFLINFNSRLELPGANPRFLSGMKNYLTRHRRVDQSKIVLVNGGAVNCGVTQLWVVPPGTAPKPKVYTYETVFDNIESARKFDEYHIPRNSLFEDSDVDSYGFDDVNSLEAFVAAVKKETNALAYVIVYPQYYIQEMYQTDYKTLPNGDTDIDNGVTTITRRRLWDLSSKAAQIMRGIQNEIVVKYKLSASRVKVINGGYRKLRQVELWIVPRGEHPPIATPNAFPKIERKSKNRKTSKK